MRPIAERLRVRLTTATPDVIFTRFYANFGWGFGSNYRLIFLTRLYTPLAKNWDLKARIMSYIK